MSNKTNGSALIYVLASVLILFAFIFCVAISFKNGSGRNLLKHFRSSVIGLERHVELYGYDGKIIKAWDTKAKVEDNGGTLYFLDNNGKAVTISGVFIVEEK